MLYILDLCGTFVFAVTGGLKAVKNDLDILGIIVLSVITGVGGGIVRDIIIGLKTPMAFQDESYLIISIAASIIVFFWGGKIESRMTTIKILDAIGMGLFASIGARKAIVFGMGPIGILMMAVITATGGGMIRDIFVREVPAIIRIDIYATAALCGGIVVLVLNQLGIGESYQYIAAIITTMGMRLLAMKLDLHLPRARK